MSFVIDIAGRGDLVLNAIVEMLKLVGEKENLFADFPIGATMQDGSKRKRSKLWNLKCFNSLLTIKYKNYLIFSK